MTFFKIVESHFQKEFTAKWSIPAEDMMNPEHTDKRRAVRKCNTIEDLQTLRSLLREYGLDRFKADMIASGVLMEHFEISSERNIFAKFIRGEMNPWCGDIHEHPDYFIAPNLKENNEHVHDTSKEWIGKASMSETHFFVIPRNLSDWTFMNGLTLGMNDPHTALKMLRDMEKYGATKVVTPGFFLHICPFNSIQLLHLHVLDMDALGPGFFELSFKNLPLEAMIEVLDQEIIEINGVSFCDGK